MEYVIGVTAALAVGAYGSSVGLDRERAFYAVVLVVVAAYYLLFAAMAGSTAALLAEAVPLVLFATAAAVGFRRSPWIIVAGLAGHGVFDFFHHGMIANPGVPAWWPGFCLAYDVVAAAYLAVLLKTRGVAPVAGSRRAG